MKAGKYYVGDLCYVMHDVWKEVCELSFPPEGMRVQGEFELKDGRKFASFGTAYGDGTYDSNQGTSHSVDSGSIGCILLSDIRDESYSDLESLGAVIKFDKDFECSYLDGEIHFGDLIIYTDYEDEEDEWESEDDEDGDWEY